MSLTWGDSIKYCIFLSQNTTLILQGCPGALSGTKPMWITCGYAALYCLCDLNSSWMPYHHNTVLTSNIIYNISEYYWLCDKPTALHTISVRFSPWSTTSYAIHMYVCEIRMVNIHIYQWIITRTPPHFPFKMLSYSCCLISLEVLPAHQTLQQLP